MLKLPREAATWTTVCWAGIHMLRVWSELPLIANLPSLLAATAQILSVCPANDSISWNILRSHTLTTLSNPALNRSLPSSLGATEHRAASCPLSVVISTCVVRFHTLIVKSALPLKPRLLSLLNATTLTL
eukprot:784743-Rhodomonas_salina.1